MMIKKLGIVLCVSILLLVGCSSYKAAPISDGSYLKYKFGDGFLTMKFVKVDKKYFEVVLESNYEHFKREDYIRAQKKGGKPLVDKYLKRPDGKLIQLRGVIGPIWTPENMRSKGSQEGVDFVFQGVQSDDIMKWKGIEVYAITATVFRGAVSGTWYFDIKTGFLVGNKTKTVISEMMSSGEDVPTMILVETNIEGLVAPGQVVKEVKPKKQKEIVNTTIKIDGILMSEDKNAVMIDEKIYKVGEVVQGKEIVEILSDRIKVRNGDSIEIIR